MCGICGFTYEKPLSEKSSKVLNKMNLILQHRGPDDRGYFEEEGISLGFRRLSIIDLEKGRQPLQEEGGRYRLILNGEIYNYIELRKELQSRGHIFKTASDAEVVVHLYEEKGPGCLHYLRGMFAFALWDRMKRRLFLARDRFGIKPLYYTISGRSLVFASEVKAILAFPGVKAKLNEESFQHYFTFQYVPNEGTMLSNIFRLPPAHYLIWQEEGAVKEQYWELSFASINKPFTYYVEGIQEKLKESIKLHRQSHVARGAFLSSGVDSSSVAALLAREEKVKTYSVGCSGGLHDELPYAAETARYLSTSHRETRIDPSLFWQKLPEIIWFQDMPVADPAAVALYFVAQLAAGDVKVVLSGEGADEVFGGYTIYREPLSLAPLVSLPPLLKKFLQRIGDGLPRGFKGKGYLYRGTTPLEDRYYGNASIFTEAEKDLLIPMFRKGNKRVEAAEATRGHYQKSRGMDPVARMQYLDFYTWLPGDILAKADSMTMAHSLELRVPFLDHPLVEFAAALPMEYKIGGKTTKYVFRKSVEHLLPSQVAWRPKLGFPVPIAEWMKGSWKNELRSLIASPGAEAYFNRDYLTSMLNSHLDEKYNYSRRLWTVVVFLIWHRLFIEKTDIGINAEPALLNK